MAPSLAFGSWTPGTWEREWEHRLPPSLPSPKSLICLPYPLLIPYQISLFSSSLLVAAKFDYTQSSAMAMAATSPALTSARPDTLLSSFVQNKSTGLSSCSFQTGRALEIRGASVTAMPVRKPLQVVAMAPPKASGKPKKGAGLLGVLFSCLSE